MDVYRRIDIWRLTIFRYTFSVKPGRFSGVVCLSLWSGRGLSMPSILTILLGLLEESTMAGDTLERPGNI